MLIWSLWSGSFIVDYFPNTFTRISQEATQFDLLHISFLVCWNSEFSRFEIIHVANIPCLSFFMTLAFCSHHRPITSTLSFGCGAAVHYTATLDSPMNAVTMQNTTSITARVYASDCGADLLKQAWTVCPSGCQLSVPAASCL